MNPIEAAQICGSAESALRHGSINFHQFPGLLKRVIEEQLWKCRQVRGLGLVEFDSLRELITTKPRRGWGEDPDKILAVIRDDAEVLTLWREAMKLGQGRRTDLVNNRNDVKSFKGTTRAYTLDRLKRERPDLYGQVVEKKLSAHAAAIQAGFRKSKTPIEQLRYWWKKASPLERDQFMDEPNG